VAGRLGKVEDMMGVITAIISSIIIGLILGALARLILPGRQNIPLWLTIVVGIIAAFIGNYIAQAFGVGVTPGIDWIRHIIQLVVAVIGISIVAGIYAKRGART
jgi:uncharacterized membrane protein YeaQ/YmgE (transglycosylase-associated protein family)